MNKKIFSLIVLIFLLNSCSSGAEESHNVKKSENLSCSAPRVVTGGDGQNLTFKAKVITSDVKNVVSNNGGNIEYFNCEKGQAVNQSTLIAKVTPDFSDPNMQNLVNQKNMILSQISNTKGIITSTQSNFSTQLNSLHIQKTNIETQLKILTDSYGKISTQGDLGVGDIDKQLESLQIQLETLDTQINDLTKSKEKLESSKKADIDKLNLNLVNTKTQTKSLIGDVLLQVDEVFGITNSNENKNDDYETYLSAKNTSLKDQVEQNWNILNGKYQNFDTLSDSDLTNYLQSLSDLTGLAKDAVKNSVASTNFPQTTIDNIYSIFFQYENNIVNAKNGIDNIIKSLDTVSNTYDTQILGLNTQINGSQNSKRSVESTISNIKSNKLGTFTTSVDLQKNQTESQIQTSKTSLSQIMSQMEALKSQEQIQLNQLNSQLSQLQSSLNTININLNSQSFYAETTGTIKEKSASLGNKVGPNSLLCQILPNKSSLKLQVYSSQNLSLPLEINFNIDGKKYTTKLITKLPYQDSVTQNYIYETDSNIFLDGKELDVSSLLSEGKVLDISTTSSDNVVSTDTTINIPVDYVSNTINNSFVKLKTLSGSVIQKEITLGELNSSNVEIRAGLQFGDTICK